MTDAKSLEDHLQKTGSVPQGTTNHVQPDVGYGFGGEHRVEDEVESHHTYVGGHLDEGKADE